MNAVRILRVFHYSQSLETGSFVEEDQHSIEVDWPSLRLSNQCILDTVAVL